MHVIGLSSFVWFMAPKYKKIRKENNISYFSFYTDRWANSCEEKVTGEKSMQQAVI